MIRTSSRPRRLRALLVAAALSVSMFASALPATAASASSANERASGQQGSFTPDGWNWVRGGELTSDGWNWVRGGGFGSDGWNWVG
jgi:Spy/CpxP family protein refolding chaperone